MKKFSAILTLVLIASLLAGCAGTPVVYNCTCPTVGAGVAETTPVTQAPDVPAVEGAVKTGLYIATNISDSASATAEAAGLAKYDVTMVAVTVDDSGVIQSCIIDGIAASANAELGADGNYVTFKNPVQTKNELGENYGMVAYGGAIAEWDAQAAALASYAVGKTVDELKNGAIDETGRAPQGSDLASSATIYLGGYVSAIEAAVANAKHLGAQAGDTLKLVSNNTVLMDDVHSDGVHTGLAQLDATVMALTMNGDTISSCAIDAVQAKVSFDDAGNLTSDTASPVSTKNELGADYGMKAYGGAIAEWDEQAASFAAYVTGKTPAEVAGIAVNEKTAPTDADLTSSVTIAIGGFQALIAKAAQ